ncbi:MAG: SDR family NAD(P)-dependent oxidoreductase [Novosphingobium sp.]
MALEQDKFGGGVAVVTGAGAGIGMGLSRRFAGIGMHVVVTDVSIERAEGVVAQIQANGGKAEALQVDVSKPEALDELAETVFAKHGSVRVLVNNAGIETMGYTWEIPAARWEATLDINIHGVVHGCRAFIPRMIAQGGESWIANLASIGAFGQMPTQTAYMMTKHAVQSFTECLYLELEHAGHPIHVSSIIPGMLKTSIFEASAGKGEPEAAARHRTIMREMAMAYGMDLDEGCAIFVRKMAENLFWVDSQPEMTTDAVNSRLEFLGRQGEPRLTEQSRALL